MNGLIEPGASTNIRRGTHRLRPDPRRVLARLFVPGQETLLAGESFAGTVIDRVLALDDAEAELALAEVIALFDGRHHRLEALLRTSFGQVAHRLADPDALVATRALLIGAYFTQEYAVEAAALCNPSLVAHPDQDGLAAGALRVVMSLRGIGEGHRSLIEFRTGVIDAGGALTLDDAAVPLFGGTTGAVAHRRRLFHRVLAELDDDDGSSAAFVLDGISDPFDAAQLATALASLHDQLVTRRDAAHTIEHINRVAASHYQVAFPATSELSQRVLYPRAPNESHGMEDARFVRFVDDDGTAGYLATYTAYDGTRVAPQLLVTADFTSFTSTPMAGRAARNKGMALFPRRVGGRYLALSRWDRENNAVAVSDDLTVWDEAVSLVRPPRSWNVVQVGNCGSPIETPAGWIMLTHGVGPMRRYVIGAELLDLDDPTRVVGQLQAPLLAPTEGERDGYVPNVVYSCGGVVHGEHLVLPYGIGDANVGVATISLDWLLDRLTTSGGSRR